MNLEKKITKKPHRLLSRIAILRSESRTAPPNGKTVKNIGYLGDLFSEARMLAGSYTRPFWISYFETLGLFSTD